MKAERALGYMGVVWVATTLVHLGYFFVSDGRTLQGGDHRTDPEFLRYWMTALVPLTLGAALAWYGWPFGNEKAPNP